MTDSYFTTNNCKDPLIVSNAKQLTAPQKSKTEHEPHPLQREFIDVLKSLGAYEEFKENLKTILPNVDKTIDMRTYCMLFEPSAWGAIAANILGDYWLNYLKQYHPGVIPDNYNAIIHRQETENPVPEKDREQFRTFLWKKNIVNRYRHCLSRNYRRCHEGCNLKNSEIFDVFTLANPKHLWISGAFAWVGEDAQTWQNLNSEWQDICRKELE